MKNTNDVLPMNNYDDFIHKSSTSLSLISNVTCTRFLRRNSLFFHIINDQKLLLVNLNFDNQCFPDTNSTNCIDISCEINVLEMLESCLKENFNLIVTERTSLI